MYLIGFVVAVVVALCVAVAHVFCMLTCPCPCPCPSMFPCQHHLDPKDAILRVLREEVDTLRSVLVEKNILAFRMFQAVLDAATATETETETETTTEETTEHTTSPREYPNDITAATSMSPSNLVDVTADSTSNDAHIETHTHPDTHPDTDSTTSSSPQQQAQRISSGPLHVDLDESESLLKNPTNHPLAQQIKLQQQQQQQQRQQQQPNGVSTEYASTNGTANATESCDSEDDSSSDTKETKAPSSSSRIIPTADTPITSVHQTHTRFFTLFESSLLALQTQLAEQLHRVQVGRCVCMLRRMIDVDRWMDGIRCG